MLSSLAGNGLEISQVREASALDEQIVKSVCNARSNDERSMIPSFKNPIQ